MLPHGSLLGLICGADVVSSFTAAVFRAALAFAIDSRKALDDLEAFLVSFSACCSGLGSSCSVEAADTYRDAVRLVADGDRVADGDSVWDVLVFRT